MQRMDTRMSICYAFYKILAGAWLALKHFTLTHFCLTFGSTGINAQIDNDAKNKDARAFDKRDNHIRIFALSLGVQVLQSMDRWWCHKQGRKGVRYKGWWYPSCSTMISVTHVCLAFSSAGITIHRPMMMLNVRMQQHLTQGLMIAAALLALRTHFCLVFRRAGITKHRLMMMMLKTRMPGHLIQGVISLAATLLALWHIFCLVFRSAGITKHGSMMMLKTRMQGHLIQGVISLAATLLALWHIFLPCL